MKPMFFRKNLSFKTVLLFLFCCLLNPHYSVLAAESKAEPEPPKAPALPVDVVEVHAKPLRVWNEFAGRLQSIETVEVKPRVTGELIRVHFNDGDYVQQGDLLFEIDSRAFKADIARIKGQLASANSQANLAKTELARIQNLFNDKVVPKRDLDNAKNAYQVAVANTQIRKAELQRAELNLDYANIRAPITGLVSRAEITQGNLIETMTGAPVLTTIVATDRLYAEFDVDEESYVLIAKHMTNDQSMPVEMLLSEVNATVYEGKIHSFDNRINTSTGTIRARAILENKDSLLLPGMFVNVRIGTASEDNQILITEKAIATDQNRKFIYTVDKENKIQYQEVAIGHRIAGKRIIETELNEGTKVVITNIQKVRPGMVVAPSIVNEP